MARISDGLSLSWTGKQWIAKYKALDSTWSAKRLPLHLTRTREGEARAWALDWYRRYRRDGGFRADNSEVTPSRKVTLTDVFERWIEYRRTDPGTDPRYLRALRSQYRNWIAPHAVAGLDIQRELGALQIVGWIRSLRGKSSTRLTIASTLSVMINDSILHGSTWGIDPGMTHPMLASPHILRELDSIRSTLNAEKVTPVFQPAEVEAIFAQRTSRVWDVRRVKYVLRLFTGIREQEAQALVWDDVKAIPTPHIWIKRQLVQGGSAPFLWQRDLRTELGPQVDLRSIPQAVVKAPKRNSVRALPLMPLVVETLKWWRSTGWAQFTGREPTDQDPIFPSGLRNSHQPYGQFCTPSAGTILLEDLRRLGIPTTYTSPSNGLTAEHSSRSFRHTFASMLSEVGIDDARIGDLLGHASKTVTRAHYIVSQLPARIEVVSKLRLPDRVVLRADEVRDPSRTDASPGKVMMLR